MNGPIFDVLRAAAIARNAETQREYLAEQAAYELEERRRLAGLLIGKTIESVDVDELPRYACPSEVILRFLDGTSAKFTAIGYETEGVCVE